MARILKRNHTRIESELKNVRRVMADLAVDDIGTQPDNTPYSETVESIQASEELELRMDLLSRLSKRAERLEDALRRLDAGSYGVCIECNISISPQRLEAIPECDLCVGCQRLLERSSVEGRSRMDGWLSSARMCDFPGCTNVRHG